MPEDMLDLEMIRTTTAVVEQCLDVRPGEEVLVLADPRKVGVARSVATAANAADAEAILTVMPELEHHGNEPTATVAEAMAAADVCFTCTTHAITHTRSRLAAAEAGTRFGILRGVTEDMLVEGAMTVDFERLRTLTAAVAERLDAATRARVTSDAGTDVTFGLEGCAAFSLDGYYHEAEGFATLPPGEAPTHPQEGTAEGTIVVDVSMDSIGLLDDPIELAVEAGEVVDVAGGEEAAQLEAILEGADEHGRNLAEFAIGTNERARLIGNQAEDKKKAGTVHFAVGDNESLGGTRRSDIHLDGVLRRPTVTLDDEDVVVEDGRLRTELFT